MKWYKCYQNILYMLRIRFYVILLWWIAGGIIFVSGPKEIALICVIMGLEMCLMSFFLFLAYGSKYRYTEEGIEKVYLRKPYKMIKYSKYQFAVISNTSSGGGGACMYDPQVYVIKDNDGKKVKIRYPFLTLHESKYPLKGVGSGWCHEGLYFRDRKHTYRLGICWFDSLKELLEHTDYQIYILEDIYIHLRGLFDMVLSEYEKNGEERFFIIADHIISYQEYRKNK